MACALDNLSARRFAEYLSLGQVPDPDAAPPADAFPTSSDEVFGALADRAATDAVAAESDDAERNAVEPRAFRSPWKWERLLAESRVVATGDRWSRRLNGLVHETELQRRELARTEPGSARLDYLTRKIDDVRQLAAFALPIMRLMAAWPVQASWAEWLDHFAALAPRVLRRPDRVLRVLADLRPMGAIGPVTLHEAARVLADRLASIEAEPPRTALRPRARRQPGAAARPLLRRRLRPGAGRADVSAEAARGSAAARRSAHPARRGADDAERSARSWRSCKLRLAVGAAESRLYVSFPTVEVGEGRPRVPSLYALEVWRAMTGRVPSADELQQAAARTSQATLAWPAPADRSEAIDALEHDLATLRALVDEPDHRARGRAHYILQLNDCLQRSVRERYMRGKKAWSHWDGITSASERHTPILLARSVLARAATRCRRCRSTRCARISSCWPRSSECGRPRISSRCSGWIR